MAFLYVGDGYRGRGIGGRLTAELEQLAREVGDMAIVVSATPSVNSVEFYRRRGYEPSAEPLPELYELEPDRRAQGEAALRLASLSRHVGVILAACNPSLAHRALSGEPDVGRLVP